MLADPTRWAVTWIFLLCMGLLVVMFGHGLAAPGIGGIVVGYAIARLNEHGR